MTHHNDDNARLQACLLAACKNIADRIREQPDLVQIAMHLDAAFDLAADLPAEVVAIH